MLISGAGVGIINSTLGVFVKPVCEALGFARGQFMLYSSISMIVCVVLMPIFGTLFRRFGFRRVSIVGAIGCGLTLLGFSFATELWHFYVIAFISGMFVNGIGIMSVGILVIDGLTIKEVSPIGIAYSGTGLIAALLIPVTSHFIEVNGWQWSFRFLACVLSFWCWFP